MMLQLQLQLQLQLHSYQVSTTFHFLFFVNISTGVVLAAFQNTKKKSKRIFLV